MVNKRGVQINVLNTKRILAMMPLSVGGKKLSMGNLYFS
jgi:hypothetical protein